MDFFSACNLILCYSFVFLPRLSTLPHITVWAPQIGTPMFLLLRLVFFQLPTLGDSLLVLMRSLPYWEVVRLGLLSATFYLEMRWAAVLKLVGMGFQELSWDMIPFTATITTMMIRTTVSWTWITPPRSGTQLYISTFQGSCKEAQWSELPLLWYNLFPFLVVSIWRCWIFLAHILRAQWCILVPA